MRVVKVLMRPIVVLAFVLMLSGCNRAVSDGLSAGLENGVQTGLSTLVGGLVQAISSGVFGLEAPTGGAPPF